MKELNELVELANFTYISPNDFDKGKMLSVHPETILAIAEAFRALEQGQCGGALLEREEHHVAVVAELLRRNTELEQRAEAAEENYLNEADYVKHLKANYRALEAKLAELEKQETPKAVVRHYTGCKYPIIKVNSLEVIIAGDRQDAEELADFINSIRPAPAINLAELVPDELSWTNSGGRTMDEVKSWNACRAAILRNIEEAK